MRDQRRIRIDPLLEQRVHQYAVRDGRSFDAAAKRLIVLGLDAVSASNNPRSPQAPMRDQRA